MGDVVPQTSTMGDVVPQRTSRRVAALACKEKLLIAAAPCPWKATTVRQLVAASDGGPLFELPTEVLRTILHRAGLRSRELCKALAHVYGPLPSLTPHGDFSFSPDSLLSTLRRCTQLRLLDLTKAHYVLTNNTLRALCRATPRLQDLRLSSPGRATPTGLAAAVSALSCLTSLRAPSWRAADAAAVEAIGQLPRSLRALTLPGAFIPASGPALDGMCPQVTRLCFCRAAHAGTAAQPGATHAASLARWAARLPALAALEVDAGSGTCTLVTTDQLNGLAGLTALTLTGFQPAPGTSTSQVLRHVGALRNLRSLRLRLAHTGWAPAERGWLDRLPLLTSLDVQFDFLYDDAAGTSSTLDEVAGAVRHMPALRELRLCSGPAGPGGPRSVALTAGAFAGIQGATALRLLHLGGVALPSPLAGAVFELTQLTSVSLARCSGVREAGWLAPLTNLRELHFIGHQRGPQTEAPPCELLAGLPHLTALTLNGTSHGSSLYLKQLCSSLPRLRRLDLSNSPASTAESIAAGVAALWRLSSLEMLDLRGVCLPQQSMGIKAPMTLRRCYLQKEKGKGRSTTYCHWAPFLTGLGQHVDVVWS